MNFLRMLYALAILLTPISYSTKLMIGIPEIIWINPTLLIALFIFVVILPPIRPQVSFYILISGFISGCLGFLFLSTSGSAGSALYEVAREPVRTALNLIWFWLTLYFIQKDRKFVVKWMAISVLIQLGIAFYLLLGTQRLLPLPAIILEYQQSYALRQIVWLGGIPVVRLAGTFIEGPPFGLFMFSGFVIFSLELFKEHRRTRLTTAGWVAALVGSVGSLATQILIAMFVFIAFGLLFSISGRRARIVRIISVALIVILTPYLAVNLSHKIRDADSLQAHDVYARSGGERLFHAQQSLNLLIDNPLRIPLGIGPGRYGNYIQELGVFSKNVDIQVTPIDWLVEYGLIGFVLICWWLWLIARRSYTAFGWIGIAAIIGLVLADMFQANWKWESWFLGLAYLFAAGQQESNNRRNSGKTNGHNSQ